MEIIWLPCFTVDAASISKAVLAAASARVTTICSHCLLLGGTIVSGLDVQYCQPFLVLKRKYCCVPAQHSPAWTANVHIQHLHQVCQHHFLGATFKGYIWESQASWAYQNQPYTLLTAHVISITVVWDDRGSSNSQHQSADMGMRCSGCQELFSAWSSRWDLLPTIIIVAGHYWLCGLNSFVEGLMETSSPDWTWNVTCKKKRSTRAELYPVPCWIAIKPPHYGLEAQKWLLLFFSVLRI